MSATQLFAAAPARACDALLSQVEGRLRDLLATEMSRWSAAVELLHAFALSRTPRYEAAVTRVASRKSRP